MTPEIYNNQKIRDFQVLLNNYNIKKQIYVESLEKLKINVQSNIQQHKQNKTNDEKHKLYQVGLSDLINDTKSYTQLKTGKKQENDQLLFEDDTKCNDSFLQKCNSRARTMNASHYGLGVKSDNNGCACYLLDNVNNNSTISLEIVSKSLSTISDTPSYISILMDGNIHSIKNSVYSDNFEKLYETDSNNENIIKLSNNTSFSNCNPFSGGGIYSLQIDSVDSHGTNGYAKCTKA
tara:strand:- start:223 stop:927 length:705 start_codon:yes stop_codon:yes gene_type:complete